MRIDDADALLTARSTLLYHRYAQAVDAGDLDALRDLATPDIRITRGGRSEPGGVEPFLDIYRAHIERAYAVCQHAVTNVIARREGGVIATTAYFQARLFHDASGVQILIGRYHDEHVALADGDLRIAHKNIQVDRMVRLPAGDETFAYAGTQ